MHIDQLKNADSEKLLDFFKNQNFDSAIDHLFSIKNQLSEKSFYYNLGILYIHKENYPAGKLNLLKSKVRGFDSNKVNSELVKLDSAMKLENDHISFKDQAMFYFGEAYQHDFIIAGSLILLFLSLIHI